MLGANLVGFQVNLVARVIFVTPTFMRNSVGYRLFRMPDTLSHRARVSLAVNPPKSVSITMAK